MSVTAAAGFRAAGVAAGVKASGGLDVAMVVNDGPLSAAAGVFTSNRAKANPVLWSEQALAGGSARAVVLNSGGANCFTGAFGFQTTHQTAERAAERLGIGAIDVQVCSTGLIGVGDESFRAAVLRGVDLAADALAGAGGDAATGLTAAQAIMTTDSVPKQAVARGDGFTVGGMAKGAGMLAPGLATMLVVLTTDAACTSDVLDRALRAATRVTFDRLDSDGCMSTNDTVLLLASGASGVEPDEAALTAAVTAVCDDLARQLQEDAEGASHDIAIEVRHAATEDEAVVVARSVARSNLFKAAIFGNDPNWGRVLAAIGTTDASFDPYAVDVHFNGVRVCHAGEPDRPRDEVDLTPRATAIVIDLFAGEATATIRTNDLTHEYVHENSAYAS
ncbi:bifunctional glutamate N-acetyltransferase/amino-acid acetyltransferase ArgJ [Agrococcus sp. SCSIO52902]|uniref:bifunctional glutamate N-acetyltransferase/amino-acid acetyltransferase ArgJ n=1 Tax=Agrococcus sp. SCSIO52902 TaxID=2933290 RepID=UPI001FF292B8|nr:bifunctional glutamate N-acetyltransferase/amino-acid acetyltransferase ArgJ [Agrococcus sp. SCSIO52902]UOW00147.1 bifunctional glutamate N-acetyltransferase/amino-acid acetyltransferase ArgJ [Agrococcus sp. SCSIO52902]